jgi:metal-sulfur cluster biosynthetic enzyme
MSFWRRLWRRGGPADPSSAQPQKLTPPPAPDMSPDADIPERAKVLEALNGVQDPLSGLGLADAGRVRGLVVRAGRAGFMLEAPTDRIDLYADVRDKAEAALLNVAAVKTAQVVLTTEDPAPAPVSDGPGARRRFRKGGRRQEHDRRQPRLRFRAAGLSNGSSRRGRLRPLRPDPPWT